MLFDAWTRSKLGPLFSMFWRKFPQDKPCRAQIGCDHLLLFVKEIMKKKKP